MQYQTNSNKNIVFASCWFKTCHATQLVNPIRCNFALVRLDQFISDAMIENIENIYGGIKMKEKTEMER